MNPFQLCIPRHNTQEIQISDSEDEETAAYFGITCCLPNTLINFRPGRIHLTDDRDIDYINHGSNPTIPLSLARQSEILGDYTHYTEDQANFKANPRHFYTDSIPNHNSSILDVQLGNIPLLPEEEDAEEVSNHRISAIMVDGPRLSDAHILNTNTEAVAESMGSQNAPTEIKVSHRVFALKQEEKEAKEDDFMHQKYNTEADTPEQPIPDIFSFTNSSVSSESEVTESDSDSLSPIELNDTDHPIPAIDNNQQRQDNHPAIIPTESYQIPSSMDTNTNHGDMKTLQSTIDAHTTSPDQHSTHPHSHPHAEPSFQLSDNTSHKYSSSVPHRRPSVVDLLGDKFENFSEKLAFIKKNILMSMDSDGEDTDDEYRASDTNHSSKRQRDISKPSWDPFTEIRSKHFRDEDKALDVYPANNSPYETPVGIQPLNYNDTVIRDAELINKMSKKTDEAQIKGSRYSARDSSMFSSSREVSDDENDEENDDDDIFDLSKVVAMSKNVRNFSEEVMGNGIRMFSDLSSRIKNANTQYHNR